MLEPSPKNGTDREHPISTIWGVKRVLIDLVLVLPGAVLVQTLASLIGASLEVLPKLQGR